jgi:hypothetical protein
MNIVKNIIKTHLLDQVINHIYHQMNNSLKQHQSEGNTDIHLFLTKSVIGILLKSCINNRYIYEMFSIPKSVYRSINLNIPTDVIISYRQYINNAKYDMFINDFKHATNIKYYKLNIDESTYGDIFIEVDPYIQRAYKYSEHH